MDRKKCTSGRSTLSSEDAEESFQKNRRQLQEHIQIKNDNLRIIFQKISKLEHLSNACACPDLAEESKIQVSLLSHDAALICDEIDRMQRELNDVEYAIRTFIDVEVSPEKKQNQVSYILISQSFGKLIISVCV
jgi:hypothetical protein